MMTSALRPALALLLAFLTLGCLPELGGSSSASGDTSAEPAEESPYAEYAEQILGSWDCVRQDDDAELTGRMQYLEDGVTTGRMTLTTFALALPAKVSFTYRGRWKLEENRLRQYASTAQPTQLSVDGHTIPPERYPPADPTLLDDTSTIIRLDDRALFLDEGDGSLECWRVRS